MSEVNNGGAEFPTLGNVAHNSDWPTEDGMSLRDYFAAQHRFDENGITTIQAEAVMAEKSPDWMTESHLDCLKWWIEAEARIRFLAADAMLKAREVKP